MLIKQPNTHNDSRTAISFPLRIVAYFSLCMVVLLSFSSCYYSYPNKVDNWSASEEGRVDSLSFYISHHYWTGYNFQATDSLTLQRSLPLQAVDGYEPMPEDTLRVHAKDRLVVARLVYVPTDTVDSVWVKIARDQTTQGWIHECDMLERVVPDDPISKFIFYFSDSRSVYALSIFGLAILFWLVQSIRHKRFRIVHFRDIPSFYPTLLCLCVSGSAALYGSIQRFIPMTWVEYYFHPTLNPLRTDIPLIMDLFIASVWLMLIVAVAVVDELRRQPDLGDNLSYLTSLGGVCMVLYLVFTLTVPIYIGYVLLVCYWVFAIRQYRKNQPTHLLCGVCGHQLAHKGKCPHCGAVNE